MLWWSRCHREKIVRKEPNDKDRKTSLLLPFAAALLLLLLLMLLLCWCCAAAFAVLLVLLLLSRCCERFPSFFLMFLLLCSPFCSFTAAFAAALSAVLLLEGPRYKPWRTPKKISKDRKTPSRTKNILQDMNDVKNNPRTETHLRTKNYPSWRKTQNKGCREDIKNTQSATVWVLCIWPLPGNGGRLVLSRSLCSHMLAWQKECHMVKSRRTEEMRRIERVEIRILIFQWWFCNIWTLNIRFWWI